MNGEYCDWQDLLVLFVFMSYVRKGLIGELIGFYFGEVMYLLVEFDVVGIFVEFVLIQGGELFVDGFDFDDEINVQYWSDVVF